MVAVAGIVASSYGAAAIGAGTLYLAGTAFTSFLVNTAIGLALYALSPKPNLGTGRASGYQTTQFGSSQPHQVIYGQARVGGVRVYDEVTGDSNKFLHRVIAFSGHEIEEFVDIYVDDEVVTLDGSGNVTSPAKFDGFMRINEALGSPTQVADADLVSESPKWSTAHKLSGISYLYIRMKYDGDVYPNGVPEITATIKGKKVYDPRDGSTAWSDNPALCLRDYLTSSYGVNEEETSIDDGLFIDAANVCDETDTLDGSTRYTCNGSFTTNITPYDMLGQLLTPFGGLVWYSQGQWRTRAAAWVAPTVSLDEGDLIGGINVSTRHSRRDNFNTVAGTFRGEESNWQTTDFPKVSNVAFVSADGGEEVTVDLPLPFTDTSAEARRISRIVLERNRQQLTISARFNLKAFTLQVGDNVRLTNSRFGWTNKEFEVNSWTFGIEDDLSPFVEMTLRETAETAFDDFDDGAVYERDNTTLYDPFNVPEVGISPSVTTTVANERVLTTLLVNTTSSRLGEIDYVEVEYKAELDTAYTSVGVGELGEFRVVDIEEGVYDIRARAINVLGIRGDWTTLQFAVTAAIVPVADVAGFKYDLSEGTIVFSWDASTDAALSYYRIRHALEETGATWANATTAVSKVSRPATSITVPARPGTYFIRAFSKTGVQSENTTSVVVPETYLTDFTNTDTQTESPTFSGTDDNTTVTTSELELIEQGERITFPQELDNAAWTKTRTTITTNNATPPGGGSAYADLVVEDTSTGTHIVVSNAFNVVEGVTYRFSGTFKSGGRDFLQIDVPDSRFGTNSSIRVDLSTGNIYQSLGATTQNETATDLGSGWWRVSFEITCTSSGSSTIDLYIGSGSLTFSYTGDGSSGIIMTDISAEPATQEVGEYIFSNYIDTTTTRRVRARVDLETRRKDDSSGLFDNLSGNFDALAGLFDDLTGFSQVDDTDVKTYISITDDDPTGTPTWTDYQEFQSGDFFGRAFRFKVKLISTSDDVTPAIDALTARVQYN